MINITDMIPEEYSRNLEGFDASRKTELDMNLYRQLLIAARDRFAFHRAMGAIRPIKSERQDPDYNPDEDSNCSS